MLGRGFVNNVPADALFSAGCNFVLAVDVLAEIEERFGSNGPNTPSAEMRSPSILQTVLRTYAVQSYNMNAVGIAPADVTITPDVSAFDMSDFIRAIELADIGRQEALKHVPTIKTLLRRVDDSLFA